MSVNSDKSDSVSRVTRSMRRLNSESESIDLENRPDTPTNRTRKKLDSVDSANLTPSKRTTRASSAQRNLIEEVIASPLRRTRRTSSDRPVDSPMKMTRSLRLSSQSLTEDDPTPPFLKSGRRTLLQLEEVAEEEPETKLNTPDKLNDLELRTRSVSKSPAESAQNKSLNTSNNGTVVPLSEELNEVEKQNGRHVIFDLNNEDEENQNDSITEELAASNNGEENDKIEDMITIQETVVTTTVHEQSHIEPMDDDASLLGTTHYGDLTNTSLKVEARMTQYEVVASMMDDFIAETAEPDNDEVENNEPEVQESNEENSKDISVFEPENNAEGDPDTSKVEDSVQKSPLKRKSISSWRIAAVDDPDTSKIEENVQKSPSKRKSNSSWSTTVVADPDTSTVQENVLKSPSKRRSWCTAVVGSANSRIDTFVAPATEQPIAATEKSPKRAPKFYDPDESEEDTHERNSLIDDEAMEVASDEESMTKSERDEMEQNEIVEEGESLGSQDSDVDELPSENEDEYDSKDSFLTDDENVENQYEMGESEEEIEEIGEKSKKRRSRIIEPSSSEDEGEKEQSPIPEEPEEDSPQSPEQPAEESPQKSPSKSPKDPVKMSFNVSIDVDALKRQNRVSSRRSLPFNADTAKVKSRNSIPSDWRVENVEDIQTETSNERKRKRESVVHGGEAKRFREMSPNESEAVHMENVEELDEKVPSATKKAKKSKEPSVDIEKILERCEDHLEKFTQEKKSKVALKRKKQEEKKAKKTAQGESLEASPGSDDKENSGEKKKKKKNKIKKQLLVAEIEAEKDDMAMKLSKHQEKLEQKREKKRKKKESKKDTQVTESGNEKSMMEEPAVVTKKKKSKAALEPSTDFNETHEAVQSEGTREKKSKKRRIEEISQDDTDIIERPKAKKKLNILQQVEDPSQMSQIQGTSKAAKENEISLKGLTVASKLKAVIPKALENKTEKKIKKKGAIKTIPEPRQSLPRPVWTSAGTFIEEPIEPYKFKSTEYKPINAAGSSSQFRVIPFEARAKKNPSKSAKMETLMKRSKAGRDKTMRNMKNLM